MVLIYGPGSYAVSAPDLARSSCSAGPIRLPAGGDGHQSRHHPRHLPVFFRTRWGLAARAVIANRDMASCLGIDTRLLDRVTFAFGAGLAGLAGAAWRRSSPSIPMRVSAGSCRPSCRSSSEALGSITGPLVGRGRGRRARQRDLCLLLARLVAARRLHHRHRRDPPVPKAGFWRADAGRRDAASHVLVRSGSGGARVFLFLPASSLLGGGDFGIYFVYAIFAVSLGFIWGHVGLLSLGHAVFFGIGAYAMSVVTLGMAPFLPGLLSSWIGMAAAVLLSALAAAILGLFFFGGRRSLKGAFLGIVTLSLAVVAERVAINSAFLGGMNGLMGVPPLTLGLNGGGPEITDPLVLYWVMLARWSS